MHLLMGSRFILDQIVCQLKNLLRGTLLKHGLCGLKAHTLEAATQVRPMRAGQGGRQPKEMLLCIGC